MNYETTLEKLAETHAGLVVMTAENRPAIRNLPPKLGPRYALGQSKQSSPL